jgi:hypothetical protein
MFLYMNRTGSGVGGKNPYGYLAMWSHTNIFPSQGSLKKVTSPNE